MIITRSLSSDHHQLILDAVRDLGYHQNQHNRRLIHQSTNNSTRSLPQSQSNQNQNLGSSSTPILDPPPRYSQVCQPIIQLNPSNQNTPANHSSRTQSSNSEWDLNLSLQERISNWSANRQKLSSSSQTSLYSASQSTSSLWVPIRLIIDRSFDSPSSSIDDLTYPSDNFNSFSQPGPSTFLPSSASIDSLAPSGKGKTVIPPCQTGPSSPASPSSHIPPASPTNPLPASPAEVNKMLRRGSSLKLNSLGDRQLHKNQQEDLAGEERAFNRRSLPSIVEPVDQSTPSSSLVLSPSSSSERLAEPGPSRLTPNSSSSSSLDSARGPSAREFTELDLLLLRIERSQHDGNDYEDLTTLQEILGQHIPHSSPPLNHLSTPWRAGKVKIVSKRTNREGKVKIKFSVLDQRCSRCVICLHQFKLDQDAIVLPCTHVFHQTCIAGWLEVKNACPLCKLPLA